jgi:hypothetical protein
MFRHHPGTTKMSDGGTVAVQFPIRFADIIFAKILDPNGRNPKTRCVVVLTPDAELVAGFPIYRCRRDGHVAESTHVGLREASL